VTALLEEALEEEVEHLGSGALGRWLRVFFYGHNLLSERVSVEGPALISAALA
jgi:hypothetical protein